MSDFDSGHDLMVSEFEPHMGLYAVSTEPALDAVCPSLSLFKKKNKKLSRLKGMGISNFEKINCQLLFH